jgi:hypothetical protein
MSERRFLLAGFQVTTIGRFWVTAEGSEAGRPLSYHGDVHWLSPDGLRGEVYVTELMRSVKFMGKEFPKQDLRKGTSLGEFHIAFNFLGPIADPKIYYKAR